MRNLLTSDERFGEAPAQSPSRGKRREWHHYRNEYQEQGQDHRTDDEFTPQEERADDDSNRQDEQPESRDRWREQSNRTAQRRKVQRRGARRIR